MDELKYSRISVSIHAVVAVVFGWLSFQLSFLYTKYLIILLGVAIMLALGYILERFIGKKGIKWWVTNGLIIYLFFWLVSWIYFFNLII